MVTTCTTSLTFNNSMFCPHSVLMCFVWIWEQTVIISLYSINWLVFITETECVYCAVRIEYLYISQFKFLLQTMPFIKWSVAGLSPQKPGFDSWADSVRIVADKFTLVQVFLPVLQFSPVSIIPLMLHTHSFTYHPRYITFLSQYFSFPLSVSFHHCSILIHSSTTHAV